MKITGMEMGRMESKPKLLLIHNAYRERGGEDTVFENEAHLLFENGHSVETLSFSNASFHSPLETLQIGLFSAYNPQSAEAVAKAIRTFKPDCLHVHNFFPLLSPAVFWVAADMGIPVVQTLHNYRLICANAQLYRDGAVCEDCLGKPFPLPAIRYGCYRGSRTQTMPVLAMSGMNRMMGTWRHRVSRYIALTAFAQKTFLRSGLGLDPSQVVVKPNFVFDPLAVSEDEGFFQALQSLQLLPSEPFVLYVGRLSEEKGIETLLETFSGLTTPLVIAGDGPLLPMVQAYAARYSNIRPVGFQKKPALIALMRQAACLVFPSQWYEGFPMTLVEAMACGTPVVASDIGGLSEIVVQDETGLLVEPGHSVALASTIQHLLTDDALAKRLGQNGRKRYLEKYTPEVNYQELLAIYQAVLTEKAQG